MRIVTNKDVDVVLAEIAQAKSVLSQLSDLSASAADIIIQAAISGDAGWALSFGADSLDTMERQAFDARLKVARAIHHFTGEPMRLGESFDGYEARFSDAMDGGLAGLDAFLARNGVVYLRDRA